MTTFYWRQTLNDFTGKKFHRNHLIDRLLGNVVGHRKLCEGGARHVVVRLQVDVLGQRVVALTTSAAHVQATNLADAERSE